MSIRQTILDTISDSVTDFVYYDRKGDEDLGLGEVEQAIEDGVITIDEIIAAYGQKLREALE